MSFHIYRGSYRWAGSVPAALRDRIGRGRQLQKRLGVRRRDLARSFADYLAMTARRLFALVATHPELSKREIRLLVQRLLALTDTVETRERLSH